MLHLSIKYKLLHIRYVGTRGNVHRPDHALSIMLFDIPVIYASFLSVIPRNAISFSRKSFIFAHFVRPPGVAHSS